MASTIVIALGTTPCTVALILRRKLASARNSFSELQENDSRMREWIQMLDSIQVVGMDVDEPQNDEDAVPYSGSDVDWISNQDFIRFRAPDPTLLDLDNPQNLRFTQDYLNERLYDALGGADNAAGGGPPNGLTIASFNQELVRLKIQSFFQNRPSNEPISFFVISSTFGGFGSGAKELVLRWIRQEASTRLIGSGDIKIFPIVMIPGENSTTNFKVMSTTGARLREISAHMTKSYSFKEVTFDGSCRTLTLDPAPRYCLLSSGTHQRESFNRICADLLYSWIATPLRIPVDSRISADIYMPNATSALDAKFGEAKMGASAGVSKIFLGSERFIDYATTRLQVAVIEELLRPSGGNSSQYKSRIEPFLGRQKLWGDVDVLVEDLLETAAQELTGRPDIQNRFADAFDKEVEKLIDLSSPLSKEIQLKNLSREQLDEVLIQAEIDSGANVFKNGRKLNEFKDNRIESFKSQFSNELKSLIPLGIEVIVDFSNSVYKVLRDRREKLDGPKFFRRRTEISRDYKSERDSFIDRLKKTFRKILSEIFDESLLWVSQQAEGSVESVKQVNDIQSDLKTQLEAVIAFNYKNFDCPNGKVLLDSADSLSSYYSDWDESKHVKSIVDRLELKFKEPSYSLRSDLKEKTSDVLKDKFRDLNVVKVLLTMYPDKKSLLNFLGEVENISTELIKVNGDNIRPECVVKVIGIPGSRANEVMEIVNTLPNRGGMYVKADGFNDPEQIVFLNYRAGIAYSDWVYFRNAMNKYASVRRKEVGEILHPAVVDCFLPTPGSRLSPEQVNLLAVQGWLLGKWDKEEPWQLKTTNKPIDFSEIYDGALTYSEAVDIASNFGVQCFDEGVRFIKERLNSLVEAEEGLDLAISTMYLEVKDVFDRHLDTCFSSSLEGWIYRQLEKKRSLRDASYTRVLERIDNAKSYNEVKQILGLVF